MESGPIKKGPRAGERAPYGLFEAGPDKGRGLFDKLRGPDHHLLIFEGFRADPGSEAIQRELELLTDRYGAAVSAYWISAGNQRLHKRYGADQPSLFLVRPDGHIAYRSRAEDSNNLISYLEGVFERDRDGIERGGVDRPRNVGRSVRP